MKRIISLMVVLCLIFSFSISAGAATEKEEGKSVETVFTTSTGKVIRCFGEKQAEIVEENSCIFIDGKKVLDLNEENENMTRMVVPTATWNLANGAKSESGSIPNPAGMNDFLKYYSQYKFKPKNSSIKVSISARSSYISDAADLFSIKLINPDGTYNQIMFVYANVVTKSWSDTMTFETPSSGYYYFQYAVPVKSVSYTMTFV